MESPNKPEYAEKMSQHGVRWLRSKHAGWILGGISFAESMFAPILIDPFLIALVMARRERWVRYVTISVTYSVLGGIAAYVLGLLFFETIGIKIIAFYGLEEQFAAIAHSVDANGFVFVLIGAFTPIPYKLVAVGSGLTFVPFVTFLAASIVGRILRLGLVGWAAYMLGPHALPIFQRHLKTFAYVVLAVLAAYLFLKIH